MKQTFQQHCHEQFAKSVKRVQEFINLGAPDLILASEVEILLGYALGAFGEDLHRAIHRRELERLRQYSGYCQGCDTKLPAARTFAPQCEQCDAKDETYADEMNRRLEDNPDEDPDPETT